MKRHFKSIICMVLCCLLIFSLAACKKDDGGGGGGSVQETTDVFVKDGQSEYQILLPTSPIERETYAASELQKYFAMATNCTLAIVSEKDVTADFSQKYISIGRTALLEKSGITATKQELNTNGFKIVTKEKSVLLVGGDEDGTLYAAYEFLTQYVGFEPYSLDEIYMEKTQNLNVKKFNIKDVPVFAKRNVYFKMFNTYGEARGLLRTHENSHWGVFGHSYFQLIPPSVYGATHKDWFWPSVEAPAQLCLTAEGLAEEMVKNLQAKILARPECDYFMVGQEDTNTMCECKNCMAALSLYGGNSGVMMAFTNKVARGIKEWQKENCPDRQIFIGAFAYQKTKAAPVKVNPTTKEYEPYHPDVVAEDNVLIQYAPLEACYAHTLMEECNASFREAIKGWQKVCAGYAIWTYSTNFTNYLMHFNNFSTIKDNYKLYESMGAKVIMDQGTGETMASPFHELRCYLQAKLMWNTNLDPNVLIDNFLRNYYKEAYPQMREYFDLIRLHYMSLDTDSISKEKGQFHSYIYNIFGINNEKAEYWPKDLLQQCQVLLNDALSKVAQNTDSELAEKMRIRILRETFAIRYLDLQMYPGYYSKDELREKIESFETDAYDCGLVCWRESTPLNDKLTDWKNRLL